MCYYVDKAGSQPLLGAFYEICRTIQISFVKAAPEEFHHSRRTPDVSLGVFLFKFFKTVTRNGGPAPLTKLIGS